MMKKEINKENVKAICPHCLKNINMVWVCKLESVIGIRYAYFCSSCQKSLGISHKNDFTTAFASGSTEGNCGKVNNLF